MRTTRLLHPPCLLTFHSGVSLVVMKLAMAVILVLLVVCAVYASKDQLPALKALGVKDSKMLTDPQIRAMAPKNKKTCALSITDS